MTIKHFKQSSQPKSRKVIVLFFVSLLPLAINANFYWKNHETPITKLKSLAEILYFYDIKTPSQKSALESLMQNAGILTHGETFDKHFPNRNHPNALFEDLLQFLRLIQEYFILRSDTQERWEVKPATWMEKNPTEIYSALETLGFTKAISPTLLKPDAICILGARTSSMQNRLNYASDLFNHNIIQAKYLVLLVGERKVTIGIDGSEVDLTAIAQKYGTQIGNLTETHMMKELYNNSSLLGKFITEIIDAPAGNLPRPTTETTLLEFCHWLKKHPDVKSVLFVSNQPYVKYQAAIIAEVLRNQKQTIQFEVIGSQAKANTKIQDLVGALGSEIWAKTPAVLAESKLMTTSLEDRNEFLKLYAKQPLLYHNVEIILK